MSRSDFMKIKGVWDVKRKIAVPSLSHQADAEIVVSALSGLAGVHEVQVDMIRQQLVVLYDVTGTDYQTIVEILAQIGYPVKSSGWARFKGGWYQYLDSNGRDNAHAPEPPAAVIPGASSTNQRGSRICIEAGIHHVVSTSSRYYWQR